MEEQGEARHVLLGVSGSVAAIKVPQLATALTALGFHVRIVPTKAAMHFVDAEKLPQEVSLFTDEDEWAAWNKLSDPVLHIKVCNPVAQRFIFPAAAPVGRCSCDSTPFRKHASQAGQWTL